jgi:hypothetical membrane protein
MSGLSSRKTTTVGGLLAASGVAILMGIITAEALYPAVYTTFANEISDLGSTRPPDPVILQPSATIFDTLMVVTGALVLIAARLLRVSRSEPLGRPLLVVPTALLGLGLLGVGVFPGNVGAMHPWFALLAFVSGGVAAVAGGAVSTGLVRWFCLVLGLISLVTLPYVLLAGLDAPVVQSLGDGGAERWVAYPVVLWLVLFGGVLLGQGAGTDRPKIRTDQQARTATAEHAAP